MTIDKLRQRRSIYEHNRGGFQLPTAAGLPDMKVPCAMSKDHFCQVQLNSWLAGAKAALYCVWVKARTARRVMRIAGESISEADGCIFATPRGTIQVIQVPVLSYWMESYAVPKAEDFWRKKLLRHVLLFELAFFKQRGEVEEFIDDHLLPSPDDRYDELDMAPSKPAPPHSDAPEAAVDKAIVAVSVETKAKKKEDSPYLPPDPSVRSFFPVHIRIRSAFVR